MEFIEGDFLETSRQISPSDIVVMDPRNQPDIKGALGLENLLRRFKKDDFRAFVHPPREMDAALREMGLGRTHQASTWVWHIDLYARSGFERR
jgi:hypothetical protein